MTIDRKLTLLACSGSILATTFFGMPSEAMPAPLNSRTLQLAAAPMSRSKAVRPTYTEEMLTHKSYENDYSKPPLVDLAVAVRTASAAFAN